MEAILLSLIAGMLATNYLNEEWKESRKGAIGATFIYVVVSVFIGFLIYAVSQVFI